MPILRRAGVTSGRCNARKGVGRVLACRRKVDALGTRLKVRANPPGNWAAYGRSDRPNICGMCQCLFVNMAHWKWECPWVLPRQNAVMPLDVLGRTRATLTEPASTSPWPKGLGNLVKLCRAGDRALQLLLFNEECLVSASHQLALITSLPFVHTARRYYRLNGSVRPSDWLRGVGNDRSEPESWSNLVI